MPPRLTQQQFIEKSRVAHGDKYDYSKAVYTTRNEEVEIICPVHGCFKQKATNHMSGYGCDKCGRDATISASRGAKRGPSPFKKTTAQFIKEAKAIHGNRYDYSNTVYTTANQKVEINCPKHGVFNISASSHIGPRKSGCRYCGIQSRSDSKRKTTSQFVKEAKAVHGNKFDYSETVYHQANKPVEIICPEHGPFKQSPSAHLSGHRCAHCAGRGSKTTDSFVTEARTVHGNRFDYSKTVYTSFHSAAVFVCREHGEFSQTPAEHLRGRSSCPDCASSGFNINAPASLYYFKIEVPGKATLYKIGVTNRNPSERASTWRRDGLKPTLLHSVKAVGRAVLNMEKNILERHAANLAPAAGKAVMTNGWSEVFDRDVLGLDKAA